MIKSLKPFIISIILLIIQISLINNGVLFNLFPNILLIYVIYISQKYNRSSGMIISLFIGVLYDSLLSPNFGIRTLILFIISIIISVIREYIYDENYKTAIFYVTFGTILYNILLNIIFFFLSYNINIGELVNRIFSIETLLSIIIFILFQTDLFKNYKLKNIKYRKSWINWKNLQKIFPKDLKLYTFLQ